MQLDVVYLWLLVPIAILAVYLVWFAGVRKLGWTVALALLVVAFARPQLGRVEPATEAAYGDLFFVFDISRSMLAQDLPPNRIQFSLLFAERIIRELPGFRFAIFPFAGDAYLQMPLTNDGDAAVEMLSYLSPELVTSPASHLDNGLRKLFETLQRLKVPSPQVILFSDGEVEEPVEPGTLALFSRARIPIHTVATGTAGGASVPIEFRFVTSANPRTHHSKVSTSTLEAIAAASQGISFPARLDQAPEVARKLKRSASVTLTFHPTLELFPYFSVLALLFFAVQFSRRRWSVLIKGVLFITLSHTASADESSLRFRPYLLFNKGVSSQSQGFIHDAEEAYRQAESIMETPLIRKKALFNLANIALTGGDASTALDLYQQAHDLTIDDGGTNDEINHRISDNMALVARLIEKAKSSGKGKEGTPQAPPTDPNGPQKNFQTQQFSADQKRKLFELLSNEERQALQRILESRNRASPIKFMEKPW